MQYVPRPSLPVANNKAAPAGGGTKRNPGRQSHVITSNGHNKEQNVENQQNGSGPQNNMGNSETMPPPKQVPTLPPEKSETVSKATGLAAAQGVSKYFDICSREWGFTAFPMVLKQFYLNKTNNIIDLTLILIITKSF